MDSGTPDVPPPPPAEAFGSAPAPADVPPPPEKRRRRPLPIALALALLVVVATVGVVSLTADHSRALALSFSKGSSRSYHMRLEMRGTITIAAQEVPVDLTMSTDAMLTVESVDASGTATVQESFSNTSVTGSGQSGALPPIPPVTLKITSDGRVLSGTGLTLFSGSAAGPTQLSGNNLSAILPDHPVNVGDSWTKSVSETIFGSAITFTSRSSYLRDERIGTVDTSVVRSQTTIPTNFTIRLADLAAFGTPPQNMPPDAAIAYGGSLSANTTTWIDLAHKEILKTTSTGSFDITVSFKGLPSKMVPEGTSFQMKGTMDLTFARTG